MPGGLDDYWAGAPDRPPLCDPDQEKGLYRKYSVERVTDSAGKHKDCRYYVLDLIHDKYAGAALVAYVKACRDEYPELADDLDRELDVMALRLIGVDLGEHADRSADE